MGSKYINQVVDKFPINATLSAKFDISNRVSISSKTRSFKNCRIWCLAIFLILLSELAISINFITVKAGFSQSQPEVGAGFSQSQPEVGAGENNALSINEFDLGDVTNWGYWLQNTDIQAIVDSPYQLFVIDYSYDGADKTAFTEEQIQQIQQSGKIVLAYLSIGEAEDYRFYWKDKWEPGNPKFILEENPEWEGCYKVKFWKKRWWKKALKPHLNRIISAGFDGVYLDIVDAYYYCSEEGYRPLKKNARDMVKLIERIARYGRKRLGNNFIICPQNGLSIIDDVSSENWRNRYFAVIDCVGVEDLFYNIWSEEDKEYRLELLNQVNQAGKRIFNVEYISSYLYDEYFQIINSYSLDIIGYPADPDRGLNELIEL